MELKNCDPEISEAIKNEEKRLNDCLTLIPSENFTSKAVLKALGSVLTNKYSEGYPEKRYYGGNKFIDEVEILAVERAKKLFGVPHANVQPYSGSPANLAVYLALCNAGDTIMGQNLPDGGHLTHGWKASISGKYFKSVLYHVKSDGYLDIEEIRNLAKENQPKIIWIGATAYVRKLPFKEMAEIADEINAYLIADISHIAGLIVSGMHASPKDYAHIITTTTHKTLRGPRGAIIMVTEKGLKKDLELAEKIDRAVFPGLQGGPHNHQTAAIAVALKEATTQEFKEYGKQIIKNSKALVEELIKNNIKLVSNGTENHMILIDLTPYGNGMGIFLQEACDLAGITLNKNTIPNEHSSPFYPSGVRLGTPAVTTRGMKEGEMKLIGSFIAKIIDEIKNYVLPNIGEIKKEVLELCRRFPLDIKGELNGG